MLGDEMMRWLRRLRAELPQYDRRTSTCFQHERGILTAQELDWFIQVGVRAFLVRAELHSLVLLGTEVAWAEPHLPSI